LLPSPLQQERLTSRNPLKGFCTILTLHMRLVPACSPMRHASSSCPLRWGSWVAYCRAHLLLPPQVGVLGGVLPSAPVATPSGGSVLLGTAASGPWLGTLLESLQRSQQLIWWKLLSTTCIPREIYPVNILTPLHSTLAVGWISAHQPIIFLLCLSKSVSPSGFVNMSAICSPVAIWYMLTVPFLTSSLKW
jgi:hypothetical protein